MAVTVLGRRSSSELFGILFALITITVFTYLQLSNTHGSHTKLADYRKVQNNDAWFNVAEVSGIVYDTGVVEEREDLLFDGVRRFVRSTHSARPDLLFMVLTKDSTSWGYEMGEPARTFHSFLDLVNSTGIGLERISLALMTASEEEYDLYRNATIAANIPRVTVLLKRGNEEQEANLFTHRPRGGRHSFTFQMTRRADLALLRNELMSRSLHDERHVVWIDSDVRHLSPRIVQTMIAHSETTSDASIITARCTRGSNQDYDKNAWAGARSRPDFTHFNDPIVSSEEASEEPKFLSDLVPGTTDNEIIRLDSVGGTILYMRASLIHEGLTFPPYFVIGPRWGRDGWDGLETEGVCYVARYLTGGGCYALGGNHHVVHTNH